jgi:peptidoglycan/LPS O-acetylase OafA/YrhL
LLFVAFELTGQFILYPGYAHNDLWNFVLNVFLLQQSGLQTGYSFNAPSWSISTEMIANCFLAVIIFYVRADRRRTVCAVALAVAVVVKLFLFGYPFVEKMFLQTALGFLSGILLAFGLADIEARGAARPLDTRSSFLFTLPWRVPTGWASDALFAVCAGLMVIWMLFASSLEQIDPVDRSSHAALDVVVMPTMVAAAIRSRLVSYLSATAVGRWLGAISYSTYLWHFPVAAAFYIIIFLGGLARAATVGQLFFVYVATVLIVADLSYRWFEWPARRWIIRRLDSRPPTIDGQGQVLDATRAAPPRLG